MDQAIWATWYDLPDEARDEYLDWLHGEYLPELQARPGFAWAAHYRSQGGGADMAKVRAAFPESVGMEGVGDGTQFLMLVGAVEPSTFMAPSVVDEQAALTGTARRLLDLRQGDPFFFDFDDPVAAPAEAEAMLVEQCQVIVQRRFAAVHMR